MKLKKEFLLHNTSGESILVPAGSADFSGVVRGNKTLGMVLEMLKKDTTEKEMIEVMHSRFDAPEGVIEKDVANVLAQLRKIGAIEE